MRIPMGALNVLRRLLPRGLGVDEPPVGHVEMERFSTFSAMTLGQVRARAESFESADADQAVWQRGRDEQATFGTLSAEIGSIHPEALHGNKPSQAWRALEQRLRSNGLLEVNDLPRDEQYKWARRTLALSATFAEPKPVSPGPDALHPMQARPQE